MEPVEFLTENLSCPSCARDLRPVAGRFECPGCDLAVAPIAERCHEVVTDQGERDERIRLGYRFYSVVYGFFALLSLWLIWRGTLKRLVRWYRASFEDAGERLVLDVGVGNGALTRLASKPVRRSARVLFLDLSHEMVRQALAKLRQLVHASFLIADAARIPFPDGSFERIFCFGAIHVFSDRLACLRSMARVLREGGTLRGSIVLRPRGRISRWLCDRVFRPWGLLTAPPTREEVDRELAAAGLELSAVEWNGQMMLFEARRVPAP